MLADFLSLVYFLAFCAGVVLITGGFEKILEKFGNWMDSK